ncbi:hypothetical protein [Micromonospora sp. NPDC023888]
MVEIARELAGVIREAMKDWGTVLRFCVILTVLAVVASVVQML